MLVCPTHPEVVAHRLGEAWVCVVCRETVTPVNVAPPASRVYGFFPRPRRVAPSEPPRPPLDATGTDDRRASLRPRASAPIAIGPVDEATRQRLAPLHRWLIEHPWNPRPRLRIARIYLESGNRLAAAISLLRVAEIWADSGRPHRAMRLVRVVRRLGPELAEADELFAKLHPATRPDRA